MKLNFTSPIAILGFGTEGQSALEFLRKQGLSDITICDQKDNEMIPPEVNKRIGEKAFENLNEFKTIIRSPGVYYKLPGILEAKEAGCHVTSMTQMTLEAGHERLTAITGSNGKTTTTGMIDAILTKHYDGKIIVGGNDRTPTLQRALDYAEQPILMEVSSFQFADLKRSPHIACILNISPNHLDWHEDLEDYIHAKANLIAHQSKDDWCILNANDENTRKLGHGAPGKIFWVGEKKGEQWTVWESSLEGENDHSRLQARYGSEVIEILHTHDLKVKTHPDNILFAVAISLIHRVDPKLIKEVLSDFVGMPQRLEFVREIKGICFYNDSSCTTPESTTVVLGQFPAEKLILLLGGSSKYSDFSSMARQIVEKKVRVFLFGVEAERIKEALEKAGGKELIIHHDQSKDFLNILIKAQELAKEGDNIVLSPACASFDMFKNSKERGKLFNEIVMSL